MVPFLIRQKALSLGQLSPSLFIYHFSFLFQHFQCFHYCTLWTLYTSVPVFPNCVPNLKNISLSGLARTLDNFLVKAVKFSLVLSVWQPFSCIFVTGLGSEWDLFSYFYYQKFQRYFELVIFLISAEEPLPPLIESCFVSLLTRYLTSYLPYMSRS